MRAVITPDRRVGSQPVAVDLFGRGRLGAHLQGEEIIMKATYQAPTLQDAGSFRDLTGYGFVGVGGWGGGGWGGWGGGGWGGWGGGGWGGWGGWGGGW
jgi:hypothetical protein